MKITATNSFNNMYVEVELSHPDYSSNHEFWFIEYDHDEMDSFEEIFGEYIRKYVSSFWHNVILKTEYVIDGKLYISKETYSVATSERVKVETKVYNLKQSRKGLTGGKTRQPLVKDMKYSIDIVFEWNDGFTDGDLLRTDCNPLTDKFFYKVYKLGLKEIQTGLFKYQGAVYTIGKVAHVWLFESTPDEIQFKHYIETY